MPAGSRLFALEVERLFQNIGRLEHIARAIAERRRGSVRIAAFPALSNRFLPAVLGPLLADRPEMRLNLEFSYVDVEERVPVGHPLRVIRGIVNEALASMSGRFDALHASTGDRRSGRR